METYTHTFNYHVFETELNLPLSDRKLFQKAKEAVKTSHAPYSKYHVGAAVRLSNGKIFTGSNQENISFPVGLCAERVAVFAAMSVYPAVSIESIAITAVADAFEVAEPVPPCGMCRQAILEYEMKFNNAIRLIFGGNSGKVFIIEGMRNLLPLAFEEKGLVK
ncbi:MAG: cytidine deaminase [Bacteroidetes bacterium]|nr:cytidine deaminase [Bacteroidota bacterium]